MSFLDIFRITKFKNKIKQLEEENKKHENYIKELKADNTTLQNTIISLKSDTITPLNIDNNYLRKVKTNFNNQIQKLKNKNIKLHDYIKILTDKNNDIYKKLQFKLSFKQMNVKELNESIKEKQNTINSLKHQINNYYPQLTQLNLNIQKKKYRLEETKAEIGDLEVERESSSYGLYRPHYDFATSLQYKDTLKYIRQKQKDSIRYRQGVDYNPNWTINGSRAQGRKNTKNQIKSIFRSFNNECTDAIKKVNYSNYDRIHKRISKSFEQHNKMYKVEEVRIKENYLDLKLQELNLAFEYAQKSEEEKEVLREERAKEREEREAQREMQKQRKKIDKEIHHYDKAIEELNNKLSQKDASQEGLQDEITKLKNELNGFHEQKENIDYRASNPTAGYVYIISNIGSFGQNMVKIGVTRRLEPEKRVQELSSASVPFKFDVHAFIFSEDAYNLETQLHHHFAKQRVNKVNNRKEFFNISIDDIEDELNKYKNVTVDFHEVPKADEYRKSLDIINNDKKTNKIKI